MRLPRATGDAQRDSEGGTHRSGQSHIEPFPPSVGADPIRGVDRPFDHCRCKGTRSHSSIAHLLHRSSAEPPAGLALKLTIGWPAVESPLEPGVKPSPVLPSRLISPFGHSMTSQVRLSLAPRDGEAPAAAPQRFGRFTCIGALSSGAMITVKVCP